MNEFEGNWIPTFTGKKFHFLNPQPEEIDIKDIAHALSLTCRFAGQCKEFYSVAEHSMRVADMVPKEYRLLALLHDASEAYLTDLPKPIKVCLPKFNSMELAILHAILHKFGVSNYLLGKKIVKEADAILLATESRDLVGDTSDWAALPTPLKDRVEPLSPSSAEFNFLGYFYRERNKIIVAKERRTERQNKALKKSSE